MAVPPVSRAYCAATALDEGPSRKKTSSTPLSAIQREEVPASLLATSTYISAAFSLES